MTYMTLASPLMTIMEDSVYLLATVDELVATLFREVLFGEHLLGAVVVLVGTIFVFLRDAVREVILEERQRRSQYKEMLAYPHSTNLVHEPRLLCLGVLTIFRNEAPVNSVVDVICLALSFDLREISG